MRSILLCLALLCPLAAMATSVAPKPLDDMVREADHVVVATITDVRMVDGAGKPVTSPDARTGPGLPNQMRLVLAVREVIATQTQVPDTIEVPLWQMWHYQLGDMRDALIGTDGIFLLSGDGFLPVYPADFQRSLDERDEIERLLPAKTDDAETAGAWWQRLHALCGNAYEGTLVRAPEGDDTFRGKRVVMHVRDCTETRVRIPLVVDDDRSRTWVLTRTRGGITLKHDHRHADGSPDAVTQYGGTTSNGGSADTQMFPADDETRAAIPGSGLRSVWLIELHPGERFTYAANRVGTERGFQVDFDLARPVKAPEAPWGWQD